MKNSILFISALATLLMASCAPTMYSPNALNVPMLSQKGEAHVVAHTNLDVTPLIAGFSFTPRHEANKGVLDQFDVSTSYAITDKVGVQANAVYVKPRDVDNEIYGSGYMGELGVGYFKKISNRFIFETYGLVAFGQVQNHFVGRTYYGSYDWGWGGPPSNDGTIKNYHIYADLFRTGIQPSIAYKRDHFFISFASRLSNLNFKNVKGELIFDNEDIVKSFDEKGKNIWLIEPAFTIGTDIKNFRVQFQTGLSAGIADVDIGGDGGFSTIGIGYNLKTKTKK